MLFNYDFYEIDTNYLKFLYENEKEVYYSESYSNKLKPYIGIVVCIKKYNYFIPLTSAKEKHKSLQNISDSHMLIYEILNNSKISSNDIFIKHTETSSKHILSVLDFRKMIPVPDGCYKRVSIKDIEDEKYKSLLTKEYNFLKTKQDKILKISKKLYDKQITTGKIARTHCDFKKLQDCMQNYIKTKQENMK